MLPQLGLDGNLGDYVNRPIDGGNQPKAYLNVLFFDERFNFIQDGSTSTRVSQPGDGAPQLVLPNIKAPKNGYAYVYLSNESDENVFFDNLKVADERGRLIEEDHYYAYGLKIAGISSRKLPDASEVANIKNNNLYNDKELFDDGDLNWYDYGYRNYDPQIGRFTQLDPLTDDYPELTNYQYAGCEPIANTDVDGLEPLSAIASTGAEVSKGVYDVTLQFTKQAATSLTTKIVTNIGLHLAVDATSVVMRTANINGLKTCQTCVAADNIGATANAVYKDGILPAMDWVNHNINPVYGVFNGINSQFTGKDFLSGESMSHTQGALDAGISLIPGATIEKAIEKTGERLFFQSGEKTIEYGAYKALAKDGVKQGHHIYQNAAFKGVVKNYVERDATAVIVKGPLKIGTQHYIGTQLQRNLIRKATVGGERGVAYRVLRAMGYSIEESKILVREADKYLESIGATLDTPTRIPFSRK